MVFALFEHHRGQHNCFTDLHSKKRNIDTSQTWTDKRVSREKRKIIKDLNEQRLVIF